MHDERNPFGSPTTDPTKQVYRGSSDPASVTHAETLRRLHATDKRLAQAFREGVFSVIPAEGRFELVYLPGSKGYRLVRRNERKLRYLLGESCPVDCEGWTLELHRPGSPESVKRAEEIAEDTRRRLAEGESPEDFFDPNRHEPEGATTESDLASAVAADTETLERINAEAAVENDMPSISDEGIDALDPVGEHIGIPFPGVYRDPAWVMVGWMMKLTNDDEKRALAFVLCSATDLASLRSVKVGRAVADEVARRGQEYTQRLKGEGD